MKPAAACLIVAMAYTACDKPRTPGPPPSPPPAPPPVVAKAGIEVALITREPRIAAPRDLAGPVSAGWPDEGRAVQWIGKVINRTGAAQTVPIVWRIGPETTRRTVSLPPGSSELVQAWLWTSRRTRVSLTIEPSDAIDADRTDNEVVVDSNALTIGMFVRRTLYEWMAQDGRPGFEVWFQGQLRRWHEMLARARFASAPDGAIDRFRLDRVVLLEEGQPVQNVDLTETDAYWVLPSGDSGGFLRVGSSPEVIADQTIVFHEILHSRGLIDLYAYAVYHSLVDGATIDISEGGRRVVGTSLMPVIATLPSGAQLVYQTPVNGVMGSTYRHTANLTEACVGGLNLWAGRRTPWSIDQFGNAINHLTQRATESYAWRVPPATRLTFIDDGGAPVSPLAVDVYVDHHAMTYQEHYRATPDATLAPDAEGAIRLPGGVLLGSASRLAGAPKAEVVILGVRTSAARGFAFVPVHYFNLLYFQQRTDLQVRVKMHR